MYYRLGEDGKTPVKCKDVLDWIKFKQQTKHVGDDTINGVRVSTVFLGIDHNFTEQGNPVLFETMVFANPDDYINSYCERYSTWDEAEAGHKRIVEKSRKEKVCHDHV